MDKTDVEFRKNCQFYYTKIDKLLKKGEIQQANELMDMVKGSLIQWEEHLKSVKIKVSLLRNIYSSLALTEKKVNYKLGRRQHNDSE
jgi:hypothetical protein